MSGSNGELRRSVDELRFGQRLIQTKMGELARSCRLSIVVKCNIVAHCATCGKEGMSVSVASRTEYFRRACCLERRQESESGIVRERTKEV